MTADKKIKTILVIEDTPKHLKDADDFFTGKVLSAYEIAYNAELFGEKYIRLSSAYGRDRKTIRENLMAQHTREITRFGIDTIVTFALDYRGASEEIGLGVDGVISDVYFPLDAKSDRFNQPEPIGVRVAIELSQKGIPFVLNTSGYHHGKKFQWIFELAKNQEWTYIDILSSEEEETHSKDWKRAYEILKEKIEKNTGK